ncbi:hypothetical protein K501DRAFT_205354 [Backusella circina FSU 941]|nr:hypothetical protein K501DRAFT_205354 [Backusella circina FSU 941]
MDPVALRWHDFADGESQTSKRHPRSPDQTSPPPPPPPPVVRRAATATSKSSFTNNYHGSNGHDNSHSTSLYTKRTLSRFGLDVLREDLTHCFCKLPVERFYTAEYGPILECGQFRDHPESSSATASRNSIVCGFHVHEYAWKKFRGIVDHGHFLKPDHLELQSCPFFNFTFCTLFDVENEYECMTPTVPLCSCKRPVIQKTERKGTTPEIVFVCKNADIDGARPKCSWYLPAKRTAFPKPKYRLHSIIDNETYFNKLQEKVDEIKAKNLHPSIIEMEATTAASNNHSDEDDDDTKPIPHLFSLVPTSVMGKRPRINRPITTNQASECASLKADLHRLREELAIKRNNNDIFEKERQKTEKLKREIEACQTSNYRLKREMDNSLALSLLCEERIEEIETQLSEMEIRKLTLDAQGMEMKDDTDCKRCHERRIEYAVAPCFHFAYCEVCATASDFKKCIVCGESIIHSQKMYMC